MPSEPKQVWGGDSTGTGSEITIDIGVPPVCAEETGTREKGTLHANHYQLPIEDFGH